MRRKGQSLIEVLISLAIGGIFIVGAVAIIAPSIRTITQVGRVEEQAQLASELMENAKSWAQGSWASVLNTATGSANAFYINVSSSPYKTTSGKESLNLTVNNVAALYSRYFYLTDVYRNASDNIMLASSGNSYDPSTKLLTAIVSTVSSTVPTGTYSIYLERYTSNMTLVSSWLSLTNASSTNGSLQLATIAASTTYQASGNGISNTYDSVAPSGTNLNSILWQGALPAGTSVTFQVGISNASSGPFTMIGPAGSIGSQFSGGNPGSSVALLGTGASGYAIFNGYRYFRVKALLFSNASSTATPTVSEIFMNWSP